MGERGGREPVKQNNSLGLNLGHSGGFNTRDDEKTYKSLLRDYEIVFFVVIGDGSSSGGGSGGAPRSSTYIVVCPENAVHHGEELLVDGD